MERKIVIEIPLPYQMEGTGIQGTYQLNPLAIRMSKLDRIQIEKAAQNRGLSLSAFIRCAAVETAKAVNELSE